MKRERKRREIVYAEKRERDATTGSEREHPLKIHIKKRQIIGRTNIRQKLT